MTALLERLDRWQQRHRVLRFPFAVFTRFKEHNGPRLAANVSYFAFFSLFPLMLALVTILGFVLEDRPDLHQDVRDSALGNVPVIGAQITESTDALSGNILALVLGLAAAIWGGLKMIDALAFAMNELWDVPPSNRPSSLLARLEGVAVLAVFGGGLVASTVLASLPAALDLGIAGPFIGLLASGAANVAVILAAQKLLVARPLTFDDIWRGAVIAGVLILVFQQLGVALVQQLGGSSDTYGAFAGIIGLLAFFHLVFRVLLMSLEINVVRSMRLVPRSLNPNSVELTDGDRRALLLDVQRVQRDQRVGYAIALGDLVTGTDGRRGGRPTD